MSLGGPQLLPAPCWPLASPPPPPNQPRPSCRHQAGSPMLGSPEVQPPLLQVGPLHPSPAQGGGEADETPPQPGPFCPSISGAGSQQLQGGLGGALGAGGHSRAGKRGRWRESQHPPKPRHTDMGSIPTQQPREVGAPPGLCPPGPTASLHPRYGQPGGKAVTAWGGGWGGRDGEWNNQVQVILKHHCAGHSAAGWHRASCPAATSRMRAAGHSTSGEGSWGR